MTIASSNTTVCIRTFHPLFTTLSSLLPENFTTETKLDGSIRTTELLYGVGVEMSTLQELLKHFNYLPISQQRSTSIDANHIEIRLAEFPVEKHNFSVKTNTTSFLTQLQDSFGPILADANIDIQSRPSNCIQYGGADETMVRLFGLVLQKMTGETVSLNKSWNDDDSDVWIQAVDPITIGKPMRAWMPIAVNCDDVPFAEQLVASLKQAGFEHARLATGEERDSTHPGFSFAPNAFFMDSPFKPPKTRGKRAASTKATSTEARTVTDVQTIVKSMLSVKGVDEQKFPLNIEKGGSEQCAILHIPIKECLKGNMLPYGGNYPGAFPITIRTDDLLLAEGLSERLRTKGFMVRTAFVSSDEFLNPSLDWGEFSKHSLANDLKTTVHDYLISNGLPALSTPIIRKIDSKEINIDLPSAQNFPLSARKYRMVGHPYTVSLNVERTHPQYSVIEAKLQNLGIRRVRSRSGRGPGENIIHFGGAPSALMAEVVDAMQPYLQPDFEISQYWGDDDRDIYIFLPELKEEVIEAQVTFDVQKWLGATKIRKGHAFVQKTVLDFQVGSVALPMADRFSHPRTPSLEDFSHYCVDSQTADLLERIAEAVVGKESLLLEGSTATSKTSSILYLAAHIGQPVMRLNLSGATDVSEFVGRFVPDETREGNGWRWEDGPVVKALMEGCWLILDELNLAESSVLERLNSILERNPSLLLSEYNDRLIGGDEFPIHSDFRVFGTQNPEHYAGRNALSPAYRDRFHETHVSNPNLNAKSMEEMLNWLVFGRTPRIVVNGLEYEGFGDAEPSSLAQIPQIERFLKSVAIFHASLCSACNAEKGGVPKIGADRMGGYSFTRRGLLRLIDFLERHLNPKMNKSEIARVYRLGLVRTYLDRVDEKEHAQVVNLMNAAGIGPETWVI